MREVVLWGLCDAATAATFYAFQDARVSGLLLLNPWVRTEAGVAKAYLKHYYLQRLSDLDFWKKLVLGQMNVWTAGSSLVQKISNFTFQGKSSSTVGNPSNPDFLMHEGLALPEKMLRSLELFHGKIAFILCENDLTAQEFSDVTQSSQEWKNYSLIRE